MEGQAFVIIDKLVAAGSRVTFLVQHSHEKLGWLQGRELNQYCRGRLSIDNHRMIYISEKGEKKSQHSFDLGAGDLKGIALNQDDHRGTFQLKFAAGNYFIATRNRNRNEASRIVDLIQQQLGPK